MTSWVRVQNLSRASEIAARARWCADYLCRLRGFAFRTEVHEGEALVLVWPRESRSEAAIHMFAVFTELGVAWLDRNGRVVDVRIAKPWRLYAPSAPAKYTLEGSPSMLESLAVGDQLEFVPDAPA